MQPQGTLSLDGDVTEITFERHLDATVPAVWAAIATADGIVRWLVRKADMGDSVGSAVRLVFDDDAVVGGTITRREPGQSLSHGWDYGPDARSEVSWTLGDGGNRTVLRLQHRGLPLDQARGYVPGWHAYLDRLASVLAGEQPGGFEELYTAAAQAYAD
jgi:uncharacterized protein YndB with AHSA1/START domain